MLNPVGLYKLLTIAKHLLAIFNIFVTDVCRDLF